MIRRTIAAHSLRHLRFARRVTGAQPLPPRAQDGSVAPTAPTHTGYAAHAAFASQTTYVSPEGRVLPIAPVLRHIPLRELAPADEISAQVVPLDEVPGAMDAMDAMVQPEQIPSEALLRLLPRLRAGEIPAAEPGEDDTHASADAAAKPAPIRRATPLSGENMPPAPAQQSEPRARSRIVELPGIVSAPILEDVDEEPGNPPQLRPTTPDDEAAEAQYSQPPVREQPAPPTVSSEPAAPAPTIAETRASRRRRGSKESTPPPPPRAADALFQPSEGDRSPQSWFARLYQAEQPTPAEPASPPKDEQPPSARRRGGQQPAQFPQLSAPGVSSAPKRVPAGIEQPTVLADSSRVLLQSLTGVDPDDVPVYRGSAAERITADQNADALTDGEAILLGAGHTTETPETLGLLAHELTHVARRHSPRFVPPVARPSRVNAPQSPGLPPVSAANDPTEDEETQARRVEAAVRNIASARTQPSPASETATTASAVPAIPDRGNGQPDGEPSQDVSSRWGNLPAPWEPLPNWMASAPIAQPRPAAPQPSPTPTPASSAADSTSSSDTPGTDSGIQRAEHGRSLPEIEGSSSRTQQARAIEPDLDVLAQQVHAILKRRLAAEQRRFG